MRLLVAPAAPKPFTVPQSSDLDTLYPGGGAGPALARLTNPNPVPIVVTVPAGGGHP